MLGSKEDDVRLGSTYEILELMMPRYMSVEMTAWAGTRVAYCWGIFVG